jgi:hypothetical protein
LFVIPKKLDTERVCREASKLLYGLGLNINQKKVKVWTKQQIIAHRNIKIYDLLDMNKTNADQTQKTCQKFAEEALTVIKKHRNKKYPTYQIKNEGLPLIKKVIGLNINKLSENTRKEIVNEIIKKGGYLKYLPEYNLTKLYKSMNISEQKKLLKAIKEVSATENHAYFDYEVMKFKRNNGLAWKRHAIKVTKITKEWKAE